LASQAGRQAAINLRAALEQQKPPPEAQTEAEKIAYCAGWWAAMEQKREQPEQVVPYAVWRQGFDAVRKYKEQPEQEPVAWMDPNSGEVCRAHWLESHAPERDVDRFSCPLYTHPPRREWRSLSEEEIQSVIQLEREKRFQRRPPLPLSMTELSHAIEAKLKEKNYG
jgi:hypothetical protein